MRQNELYLAASIVCLAAFAVCVCYVSCNSSINYENTLILAIGLLSLSKAIEYYEKHLFKLQVNNGHSK